MMESIKPTARISAIQGQFGPRLATYSTQLPPGSIETILAHDPRSKGWKKLPDELAYVYSHLQRATNKSRLESIIRYIRHRFVERPIIIGAFPAISIAVQNPTPFVQLDGAEPGVGALLFDLSLRNRRVVVDGLARVSATLELLEMAESAEISQEAKDGLRGLLNEFALPTVFYVPTPGSAPLTLDEMQQLFHDFNFRLLSVPPRIAIALDHSDLYISLTNRLGESAVIRRFGGMEMKASSLGSKSSAIVVQQNMLRFVRAATEGERFIEATTNKDLKSPSLTEENINAFEDKISRFLENFATGMGEDNFKNRDSLHLTSPGWGALGVLYHDLAITLGVPDIDRAAQRIGAINWHRSAPEWAGIVRERQDRDGNATLGLAAGGAQNRRFITKKVREILGIDRLLADKDAAGASDGAAKASVLAD